MVSNRPLNYLQAHQESFNHLAEHWDPKEPATLLQSWFNLCLLLVGPLSLERSIYSFHIPQLIIATKWKEYQPAMYNTAMKAGHACHFVVSPKPLYHNASSICNSIATKNSWSQGVCQSLSTWARSSPAFLASATFRLHFLHTLGPMTDRQHQPSTVIYSTSIRMKQHKTFLKLIFSKNVWSPKKSGR